MDTAEVGSEDAAVLALQQRVASEEAEDAEDETEPQDTDPNAEAEASDSDEDTVVEMEEVEIDGLKLNLPKEQAETLRKGALRQSDYSRKMNEVAAIERTAKQQTEQAERLVEGATKYATAIAEVQMLDAQIKRFDGVNWPQLRQDNPAEYAAYAADLQTLRYNREQADHRTRAVSQEVEQTKFKALVEKRDAMHTALTKDLKGWGDAMGTAITAYAQGSGVRLETLQTLTDPAIVIALEKARKFDALEASKTALKVKVKDVPPVLKPGVVRKSNPSTESINRFRQTRSDDDAIAALVARSRR
jgi:hypothetical protein